MRHRLMWGHRAPRRTRDRAIALGSAAGIIAVLVAACSVPPETDAAAGSEPGATPSRSSTAAAEGTGEDRLLPVADVASITGIDRLSDAEHQQGEGGPLLPACGERMPAPSAHRWWDYTVEPLEDREHAEFIGVAVSEWPDPETAAQAYDAVAAASRDCDAYTFFGFRFSVTEIVDVDVADGGFVVIARATETQAGGALPVPVAGCQLWVRSTSFTTGLGVFVTETRLDPGACVELTTAAGDRLR